MKFKMVAVLLSLGPLFICYRENLFLTLWQGIGYQFLKIVIFYFRNVPSITISLIQYMMASTQLLFHLFFFSLFFFCFVFSFLSLLLLQLFRHDCHYKSEIIIKISYHAKKLKWFQKYKTRKRCHENTALINLARFFLQ